MFQAGDHRALNVGDLLAAANNGVDSYQAAFFVIAVFVVLLMAWNGWRLGLFRQIISILALASAYIIGYFGGGALGPLLGQFLEFPDRVLAVLGAVVLGFVVYCGIIIVGAVVFKKTSQQSVGLVRLGYGMSGAACGAFYGLFLVWIAILAIRLLGSVAETQIAANRNPRLARAGKPTPTPTPAPQASAMVRGLAHMKQSLEQGPAGMVVQQVDPIPGTLYTVLHKLGVMASDEKSMDRFLNYPGAKQITQHPKIAALQNDPDITRDILNQDFLSLIRNRRIIAAANDAEIAELLRKFEFEKALDQALQGTGKDAGKAQQ